jgi:hypothetical protein
MDMYKNKISSLEYTPQRITALRKIFCVEMFLPSPVAVIASCPGTVSAATPVFCGRSGSC